MDQSDVIVIGASAGGIEALKTLVAGLPRDLPAAVLVVVHINAQSPSVLARILDRAGPLPAVAPADGDAIEPGRIHVAPPDHHLVVDDGHVRLSRGPKEHQTRPAVDPLFQSAAADFGSRVIGVILSGGLSDGAQGLLAVKLAGGIAVVQDPDDALFPQMPRSALKHVDVDHRVAVADMPALLARLVRQPARKAAGPEQEPAAMTKRRTDEIPQAFACPDCGGTLREFREGTLDGFRCHIGHSFTSETLMAAQSDALEHALWLAFRIYKERIALFQRMIENARGNNHPHLVRRWEEKIRELEENANTILQAVSTEATLSGEDGGEPETTADAR